MKDCYKYKVYFSEYIDGNISATLKKQLLMHLEICSRCRNAVNEMIKAKQALQKLPSYKTSPSFDVVLKSKIRKEARKQQERKWYSVLSFESMRVPAFAFSAAVLILLGVILERMIISPEMQQMPSTVIAEGQIQNNNNQYASFTSGDSNGRLTHQAMNQQQMQSPQLLGSYTDYYKMASLMQNQSRSRTQPSLGYYHTSYSPNQLPTLNYDLYIQRLQSMNQSGIHFSAKMR